MVESTGSEIAALSWLASQPGVSKALELAESGKDAEAARELSAAVKTALGIESDLAGGSNASAGKDAAAEGVPTAATGILSKLFPAAKRPRLGGIIAEEATTTDAITKGSARCVCIAMSGMHGSGKSAVCSILKAILGGTWIHYDEISSAKPGAECGYAAAKNASTRRRAFACELQKALTSLLQETSSKKAHTAKKCDATATASPPPALEEGLEPSPDDEEDEGGSKKAPEADVNHLILVDRTHIMKSQRAELFKELHSLKWKQRGCRTLYVEFTHKADTYGYGSDGQLSKRFSKEHLALCGDRIVSRGNAHHSLRPTLKLQNVLQQAARTAEAPNPEELLHFDCRMSVDVAETPAESAMAIIEELRNRGWLQDENLQKSSKEELFPKVEVAWQVWQLGEDRWRKGTGNNEEQGEWLSQCKAVLEADKAEKAKEAEKQASAGKATGPCWKFCVPEVSQVLTQRGILPESFEPSGDPHVVLLKLLPDGNDEASAKMLGLQAEQLQAMCEALEALSGEDFEARMTKIIIEETVALAMMSLPPILPCANKAPHVILGTRKGVTHRNTEEILEDVKAGKLEGLTCIQLPTPRPLKGRVALE
eukprot:TRINITY_DN26723_c0_g1_i2.p1 TRINITY_DN26723_c0_g1~~TRINITY_DN26723_c0_g1_i2.p1  ORF type:complete len:597 (-),score=147.27 TRINITY_DN26723_c0_g1_i2:133-1923(-)